MASTSPIPVKSGHTVPTTDLSAARRAKKREQDRRCQRLARERTKNRMTYLEGLVSELKQQNATERVQALYEERDRIAAERDAMAQTLRTIERALQTSRKLPTTGEMHSPNITKDQSALFPQVDDHVQDDTHLNLTGGMQDTNLDSDSISQLNALPELDMVWPEAPTAFCCHNLKSFVPLATNSCECSPAPASVSTPPKARPLNLWRFANDVLSLPKDSTALTCRREDALKDDTPIRALIEGWDAVEQRAGGILPPSWAALRRIDETVFCGSARPERLASLRVMQSLFLFHQDPSTDRRAAVPDWYLARPSQDLAHSYAIDYFPWPGLRERFVFHEHKYCSNKFWHLLVSDFRILWPFEFRDCYTRNVLTGEYKISAAFDERIGDIRAWTAASGILETWPEFRSDIAAFDPILTSLSLNAPEKQILSIKDNDDAAAAASSEQACHDTGAARWGSDEYGNQGVISQGMDSPISPLIAGYEFSLQDELEAIAF